MPNLRPVSKAARCLLVGAAVAALLSQGPVHAKDLGVQGKIWDITEIDMRVLMLESALRANFPAVGEKLKQSAASYLDNLPKRQMVVVEKTETRWIDPSVELTGDLDGVSTDEATGDYKWTSMYRKGTRVNPLKVYRPATAMLFFDGQSEEQVAFIERLLVEDIDGRVVLVEATGHNIAELAKKFKRPVFYAFEHQIQRFNIHTAPSLLYAGSGERDGLLGLTSFAKPFDVKELQAVWELDMTKLHLSAKKGAPNATKP